MTTVTRLLNVPSDSILRRLSGEETIQLTDVPEEVAFGLDRSDGLAGYHYDFSDIENSVLVPITRRYWRFNLGYGHRFDIPAWDAQLGLGLVHRWTSSSAYALHRLQSWDLGAMLRWDRWTSAGFVARQRMAPTGAIA